MKLLKYKKKIYKKKLLEGDRNPGRIKDLCKTVVNILHFLPSWRDFTINNKTDRLLMSKSLCFFFRRFRKLMPKK